MTRSLTLLLVAVALILAGLRLAGGGAAAPPRIVLRAAEPRGSVVDDIAMPEGAFDRVVAGWGAVPRSMAEVHALRARADAAGPDDVPALRHAALTSDSPLVVAHALRVLGRERVPIAADMELMALLEDPRPRVRQELVMALGASGDREGLPALARVARGTDEGLRSLAIQAMGRIGGTEVVELLARLPGVVELTAVDRAFVRAAVREAEQRGVSRAAGLRATRVDSPMDSALPDGTPGLRVPPVAGPDAR